MSKLLPLFVCLHPNELFHRKDHSEQIHVRVNVNDLAIFPFAKKLIDTSRDVADVKGQRMIVKRWHHEAAFTFMLFTVEKRNRRGHAFERLDIAEWERDVFQAKT